MNENETQIIEVDRIKCMECGRWFRALPRHLAKSHGLTCDEYRVKFKIPASVALVCEAWSERASEVAKSHPNIIPKLSNAGPKPGFKRSEASKLSRKAVEQKLHLIGTAAASKLDKTQKRRKLLEPYPVTVEQAAERLACSIRAAYTFLNYCVKNGKLKRIKRGLYGQD